METPEQCVKFVQSQQERQDTRTTSTVLFWFFYCSLRTGFRHYSSVSIINLVQASDGWERTIQRK